MLHATASSIILSSRRNGTGDINMRAKSPIFTDL